MFYKFLLVTTLLIGIITINCIAQSITNYTFTASSGSFTALSGATSPSLTSGNADDGYFNGLPIGFDFWYMGTRYTTVSVSTNGWLTLGANITNSTTGNALATAGAPRPVIAPLWDDLDLQSAANLSYLTNGSAGSRVFTLQFLNEQWQYNATGNTMSFQVKLYESTGKIEFVYRRETGTLSSASASIGIAATATGSGNFLSLNGSGTSPSVSSTAETTNISAKPATGQTYTFTPVVPAAPGSLTYSSVGYTSMNLNWVDNSSNERGFVIYKSTDGVTYAYSSQTAANTTSSTQSGLTVGTKYYWKVYAVSEGGLSSALSGSSCTVPNISQIPITNLIAHYKLNGNANDATFNNNGTLQNAPTQAVDRFDIAASAYAFNGSSQYISTANLYTNPGNYSMSIWFKTSTTSGGLLMGFGSSQTGSSVTYDRNLYMDNSGLIFFGCNPTGNWARTIRSTLAYNDNNWHLVTATLSSTAGMILYVDGAQVAANASVTGSQAFDGYWRIGYDNLQWWDNEPASYYFNGTLDDAMIYHRALTSSEVTILYQSPDGAGNNGPVCAGAALTLTATTVSGASYSWTGPNSFTSSSQNPTLSYTTAAAGVYTLQVTAGSGCTENSTAYTRVASTTTAGEWTGNISSDWANVTNWCNGVLPTSSTNVTITSSATRMPSISSSVSCNSLTINSGASLTIAGAGTLNIAGTLTNNGAVTNSGTINFNGTSGQQTFSGLNTFYNLSLNNSNGLLLPAATIVSNNLTISTGTLNANNFNLTVGGNWGNSGNFTPGAATVTFNGTTTISGTTVANTFNNFTLSASSTVTSSTGITGLVVNGTLTTGAGSLLDLGSTTILSGTLGTISNGGTIKTSVITSTSAIPIPTGRTWGGTIEYAALPGAQTVLSGTYNNLKLSNTSGTNTINGNITVDAMLTLTGGNLATNTNKIILNTAGILAGEGNGKNIIGTLEATRSVGTGSSTFGGMGLSIATGADDLGTVTVVRSSGPGKAAIVDAHEGINRTWDITITGSQPSSGRSVTFSWTSDDDNGKDQTLMQLYRRETSSDDWEAMTSAENVSATRTITYSTTHFSQWTASDLANPLPVTLLYFSGHRNTSGHVELKWATAAELNNAGFDVERSIDGKVFSGIGFVKGKGTAKEVHPYTFTDKQVQSRAYYRLKQVDYDNNFEYSPIIWIESSKEKSIAFYPNPVTDKITLIIDDKTDYNNIQIQVIAGNGNILIRYKGTLVQVTQLLNERLDSMSPGLYNVIVTTEDRSYSGKILKK